MEISVISTLNDARSETGSNFSMTTGDQTSAQSSAKRSNQEDLVFYEILFSQLKNNVRILQSTRTTGTINPRITVLLVRRVELKGVV